MLREVVYATRSAFAVAAREQSELALARANLAHWQQTVALTGRRLAVGDVAAADVAKLELEAQRAAGALREAEMEHAQAREDLAWRMGLAHIAQLPEHLQPPTEGAVKRAHDAAPAALDVAALTAAAIDLRPDVQATGSQHLQATLELTCERRAVLPDVALGVGYTRSKFAISGDNPHSMGFNVVVPLPLVDHNQTGIARARLARRAAANGRAQLLLAVRREVAQAAQAYERALDGVARFEGDGMLRRAEAARDVARRSLAAGALSLLDVLEAERTALEVQAEYLAMQHALHQAHIDLAYVTSQELW